MRYLSRHPNILAACVIVLGIISILSMRVILKLSRQDAVPLHVVALSEPVAALAKQVGDKHVQVDTLPSGERSAEERRTLLQRADVILGIGATFDMDVLPDIEHVGKRDVYVELLHYVPTQRLPHGDTNPYVWYGPSQVKVLGKVIRDALTQKDAVNGGDYHVRAHLLGERMDQLKHRMNADLAGKEGVGILVFHQGFAYFFQDTPLHDNMYVIAEESLSALGLTRILGLFSFASGYSNVTIFAPIHVPGDIVALIRSVFRVELRYIPDTTVRPYPDGVTHMLESSLEFVSRAL